MTIRNSIQAMANEIAAYRRTLHENPQTAYEETFASNLVQEKLTQWGIPFEAGIAETGIVATITGQSDTSGKAIGLRADMDALDIVEDPRGKPHASKTEGKMHGCGHDGHTAMLLGAAKYLSENRNFDGRVYLIFQPAEEGAGGAHRMIAEGLFDRFPCDRVFAMHNWPRLKFGTIATCTGPVMAAADRFDITIKGAGGHAAQPHLCTDPIVIASQLVVALQTIASRYVSPMEPVVLSITNFNAGTGAFNVIPDDAVLSGTLRTFDTKVRADIIDKIIQMTSSVAQSYGGQGECAFEDGAYDPTVNDEAATQFCLDIAKSIVGDDNVDGNLTPTTGAEDFGAMLQKVPGCYIMMGQGVDDPASPYNQGLHTPRYDFNDDLIAQGIEYWVRVVERSLPAQE